jgi:spore maturation protein SpmA
MGLLDAIDKLLEPITKKIFATEVGKNIELMDR